MINYLGFQISKQSISPDPNMLKKIVQVATLSNRKELESLLGLANFYSRYLPKYSELIEPFNDLRKMNCEFKWISKQERAFNKLKKALMEKPIVKISDPKKEILLITDASECTVSVIFVKAEVNYSNIKKEVLLLSGAQKELTSFY